MNNCTQVSKYNIHAGFECRIAVISDLHDCDGADSLVVVEELKPDFILLPGDMLERYDVPLWQMLADDVEHYSRKPLYLAERICSHILGAIFDPFKKPQQHCGIEYLKKLTGIAPVFYSLGNHEKMITQEELDLISGFGVSVLINEYRCIDFKGSRLVIGGLSDGVDLRRLKSVASDNFDWLSIFFDESGFKVLLCHRPECFSLIQSAASGCNFVQVSGHAHGGQIRIGKQGLFASGQGFFPKYTKGLYIGNNRHAERSCNSSSGKLIVTAGLCTNEAIPRINNPLEIAVVDFV